MAYEIKMKDSMVHMAVVIPVTYLRGSQFQIDFTVEVLLFCNSTLRHITDFDIMDYPEISINGQVVECDHRDFFRLYGDMYCDANLRDVVKSYVKNTIDEEGSTILKDYITRLYEQ